jgi:predicted TIM-barrel fold metal-dependent hydrolase
MQGKAIIVSTDGHAGLKFRSYKDYIEKKYHPAFDDLPNPEDVLAQMFAANPVLGQSFYKFEEHYRETAFRGVSDPHHRVRELEADGIVAEILFPFATTDTSVPWSDFLAAVTPRARDEGAREMRWVGEKAYNRWIAEFCSGEPDRLFAQACLPVHDVSACVDEVYWAKRNGFVGVLLPIFNYDLPEYLARDHWDPLWRACEDTGLVLAFHGGSGMPEFGGHMAIQHYESGYFMSRPFFHMMYAGVFDDFPGLKMCFTENFISWIVPVLKTLEAAFDNNLAQPEVLRMRPLKKRPREYWRDHCGAGLSMHSRAEVDLYDEIGIGQLMYGADFPHPEGGWGQAKACMRASYGAGGLTEEGIRQLVGENAIRFYGLDRKPLEQLAEAHGPDVREIVAPLSDSETGAMIAVFDENGREIVGHFLRQPLTAQGGAVMAAYV